MALSIPFQPHDSTGNHRFQPGFIGNTAPKRNLIIWQTPHLGSDRYIEMYVNPQSLNFANRKTITQKRTKGGFLIQYWGEELETLSISGETGDGGIEALYALLDVYRSEQLAFESIANTAAAGDPNILKQRQPLAPLAASVVMWYMGEGRRGFFMGFQYDESTQKNGSLSYRIDFTVVEQIGRRKNFMPWHRKPWSTTDTPVVASNGKLIVTGGYAGEPDKRVGPLNSVSGKVEYQIETVDDTQGNPQTVVRAVWTQNELVDPKVWKEEGDDLTLQDILDKKKALNDAQLNEVQRQAEATEAEQLPVDNPSGDELPAELQAKADRAAEQDAAAQSGTVPVLTPVTP
jgi:hypothetical protein